MAYMEMTQANQISKKVDWIVVVLIVAVALGVRVVALISFHDSLYGDFLLFDEQVYHNWAVKLTSGDFGALAVSDFAPLPAYVMAAVYKVFSPETLYVRIMNMIFGVTTCLLVFLIGKRLSGTITGTLSGLAAALYAPFIFFSIILHKTALSVLLFAAFVYVSLVWLDKLSGNDSSPGRDTLLTGLLGGILLGLLINVRSNCVVLGPAVVVCVVWVCLRRKTAVSVWGVAIAGFAVGFVVAVSPFVIREYRMTGELAITPAGGFNLYIANNPDNPLPYYRPVKFAMSKAAEQAIGFVIEASRREERRLTPREASDFWTREVVKYAIGQPVVFARKMAVKTLAVFNQYESADNHHLGFLKDHIGFLRFPFLPLWLVMPFGMAGLTILFFRSEKTVLTGLVFFCYALTMVIFFANVRIRLPVMVILIPFAVMGLSHMAGALKAKRMRTVCSYGGMAVFFFGVAFLPVPGSKDPTAYLNIHAAILDLKGREKEAFVYWERSAALKQPYSAFANLAMAGKYLSRGDTAGALSCIDRVPDASMAAAIKYSSLGDLRLKQGKTQAAIDAYRKSLEINSGQRRLRMTLCRIYGETDKALADREYAAFKYISSFYGAMQ